MSAKSASGIARRGLPRPRPYVVDEICDQLDLDEDASIIVALPEPTNNEPSGAYTDDDQRYEAQCKILPTFTQAASPLSVARARGGPTGPLEQGVSSLASVNGGRRRLVLLAEL